MQSYLIPLQYMMEPSLSCNLFHKVFGKSRQWEQGVSQSVLGDLTEEEGLIFEVIRSLVQPHS